MKRSGFKRAVYAPPRAPLTAPANWRAHLAPVQGELVTVPKEVRARSGKYTPSAIEARWMAEIVEWGCVACRLDGNAPRPTAVHHILRGGRRIGHLFTIGLCDPGHHQNGAALGLVSRHPYKARFEARYGSELELLGRLKVALGYFDKWEVAK